jgi:hypothetical protein
MCKQLDLDDLTAELLAVVDQTVEPNQVCFGSVQRVGHS